MFVLVTSLCLAFSDVDIKFEFVLMCIQSVLEGQQYKQQLALVEVNPT